MSVIAPYITVREYACKHCGKLPPDLNPGDPISSYAMFFETFRRIREEWGSPILINSGYRCETHNSAIGGEQLSVHLFGLALDLDCKDANEVDSLYKVIKKVEPDLRIGLYKIKGTFIHIDMGYLIFPRATDKWTERARWYQ